MFRLERTSCIDSDVFSLLGQQFGQLHAKPSKMKPSHLFVEVFRQNLDLLLVLLRATPLLVSSCESAGPLPGRHSIKVISRSFALSRATAPKYLCSRATTFWHDRKTQPRPKLGSWSTAPAVILSEMRPIRSVEGLRQ